MTEATVGDGAPAVNSFRDDGPLVPVGAGDICGLGGLPRGLYCRADEVLRFMGWNRKLWKKWKDDGLRTQFPGTSAEYVLTDWVIDYLSNRSE